jgi:hypothetical protein
MKPVETVDKWFNVIMMTAVVFFAHILLYWLIGKGFEYFGYLNQKVYNAIGTACLFIGAVNAKRAWHAEKEKAGL